MKVDDLKPDKVLLGPIFPEPVQIMVCIPMGNAVRLGVKVEHYRLKQDSMKHPVDLKEDATPYRTGGDKCPPQKITFAFLTLPLHALCCFSRRAQKILLTPRSTRRQRPRAGLFISEPCQPIHPPNESLLSLTGRTDIARQKTAFGNAR